MKRQHIISIILLTTLLSCITKQNENYVDKKTKINIKAAFENWTKSEIKKGKFFASDSCNIEYYSRKDSLGLQSAFGLGIPEDSTEINTYYADLNDDNRKDALITFNPQQCDGGNATMWTQYKLLVLSKNGKYSVCDNFFKKFETTPGFFQLDSASNKAVYGTYFEFTDNDGRCCPSIKKPIKIDLEKSKLNYITK